jgi:hypothetical protein
MSLFQNSAEEKFLPGGTSPWKNPAKTGFSLNPELSFQNPVF